MLIEKIKEGIVYKKEGKIATITINRAKKMNSITRDMGIELNDIANKINSDDEVAVVLLTSEGNRSFSTGSDITMLEQYGTPFELKNRLDYCVAIRNIRKPVISKVKGYVIGGGLELLLATDIRIADETSTYSVAEVKHGWTSGSGATQLLGRQIGYNRAAELVLTGKKINADEALRLGIINQIVDSTKIDEYVQEILDSMSNQSSIAMQLIKQNLRASQNMSMEAGLQYENDLFVFSMTTKDAEEGKKAFTEKRKPEFK